MDDVQARIAFAALGNEVRFTAFRLLAAYGREGLPAGVLAERVGLKPTAISFHLSSMAAAGVLVQRRMRRNIFYSINEQVVAAMASFLATTMSADSLIATASPEAASGSGSMVVAPLTSTIAAANDLAVADERLLAVK